MVNLQGQTLCLRARALAGRDESCSGIPGNSGRRSGHRVDGQFVLEAAVWRLLTLADPARQGSFNYSDDAAHKNSENVLVNWGKPKLAEVYLKHFKRNYDQATAYPPVYHIQEAAAWNELQEHTASFAKARN